MHFKGIIFDFNGVLIWDSPWQERAWKEYSKQLRGTAFSEEEMQIHVHGRNNRHTLFYLTGRELTGEELRQRTQEKETIYRNLCLEAGEAFRLSPGAACFLDWLKENKIPRTIATASEISNLEFFIHHLNLDCWFDVNRIVFDDGSIKGKPDPEIYLKAAAGIELPPELCVVVEDSVSGIKAAHSAGIGCIIGLGAPAGTQSCQFEIRDFFQFPKMLFFAQ